MTEKYDVCGKATGWYDEENGITRWEITDKMDAAETNEMIDISEKLLLDNNVKRMLVSLRGVTTMTNGARKTLMERAPQLTAEKTAIVGMSPVLKMISKIVFKMMKKSENAIFDTEAEAIKWLKS